MVLSHFMIDALHILCFVVFSSWLFDYGLTNWTQFCIFLVNISTTVCIFNHIHLHLTQLQFPYNCKGKTKIFLVRNLAEAENNSKEITWSVILQIIIMPDNIRFCITIKSSIVCIVYNIYRCVLILESITIYGTFFRHNNSFGPRRNENAFVFVD